MYNTSYMDYLNKDGTITISGVVFDFPQKEDLKKWDYKKQDKKTTELWLSSYHNEGDAVVCWQYCFIRGAYNKITMDGTSLKGEDKEKVAYVFEELEK